MREVVVGVCLARQDVWAFPPYLSAPCIPRALAPLVRAPFTLRKGRGALSMAAGRRYRSGI